ncbi:hypothetical protein SSX86_020819 [Deinandra increscens subsp. villosa]|uniref:Cyclopropane-fatty-acyl-phospholipid synthase n=1 Tax=Deinandra increscens subsp. villosa TaxID=3103831 RepID=A0AAP0CNL5_9ASTR
MKVAVVGGGLCGLVSAYVLAKEGVEVVLYEKEDRLGGHAYAKTTVVDGVELDLGIMVFNRVTYPNMMEVFETLGIDMEASDMSFSNINDKGLPFLVTINPPRAPESTVLKWATKRPIPSLAASKASLELHTIQGKRNMVFCGAYQGYGLHEDGVKIVTKAELGLAEAYINGDFTLVDKNKGLLDMITARVEKNHQVLDIGCGWGAFAIEIVKQTGCKYTGITLSKEQIKYAEIKVKEAHLQDRITFLLCDYRQLPDTKYDRIISCEAIEHFGHEYYEEFFQCCDSALTEDGIFVLQFTSVQDERYDEFRRTQGFVGEYIFPGGNLPSLSILTSAMAASSRFSVDHVEKIGKYYHRTIRCWRAKFLKNQSKILALGFNQEFIRTWEYYFDITAAGFNTETLMNYQVVFSRPGNMNFTL